MATEQLLAQQKRRKRKGGHNSACWICQRAHRACDVGRPCQRCNSIGTAEDCCNPPPPPKKEKTRLKFITITTDSFLACPSPPQPIPNPPVHRTQQQQHQPTSSAPIPVRHQESPDSSSGNNGSPFSDWRWQQVPCAVPEGPAVLAPTVGSRGTSSPSRSKSFPSSSASNPPSPPHSDPSCPPSFPATSAFPSNASSSRTSDGNEDDEDDTKDRLLLSLLEAVRKLNETTGRLKNGQLVLGRQLFALRCEREIILDDFDGKRD